MEEGRGEGASYIFLLMFFFYYYCHNFYAIIFMRLFYFQFYVVLLTRGLSNWERGRMWWCRYAGDFFYLYLLFLFLFFWSFCCLCGSVEWREHVLSWQDYASRIMQETCQGPNEAVVMVDGVSISITVDATIIRTMWTEGRTGRHGKNRQTQRVATNTYTHMAHSNTQGTGTVQTNTYAKKAWPRTRTLGELAIGSSHPQLTDQ